MASMRSGSRLKSSQILTVPTVEKAYYEIRGRSKTEALTRPIDLHDLKLGIIFCNTKRMVDDRTDELVARSLWFE